MTALVFGWSATAFVIGYLGRSHDVQVMAWVLLGMGVVMWVCETSYRAYVKNANASALLRDYETRRRQGGAL